MGASPATYRGQADVVADFQPQSLPLAAEALVGKFYPSLPQPDGARRRCPQVQTDALKAAAHNSTGS